MPLLTKKLIRSCSTPSGGFTKATVLALGVAWDSVHHSPTPKGWAKLLRGKSITEERLAAARAGAGQLRHNKPKKEKASRDPYHPYMWRKRGQPIDRNGDPELAPFPDKEQMRRITGKWVANFERLSSNG